MDKHGSHNILLNNDVASDDNKEIDQFDDCCHGYVECNAETRHYGTEVDVMRDFTLDVIVTVK